MQLPAFILSNGAVQYCDGGAEEDYYCIPIGGLSLGVSLKWQLTPPTGCPCLRHPMTPDQFRAALADLGLSQVGFARLAMVDARTVRRWCDGTRAVPGPVVALLGMMAKDECREIPLERWRALLPERRD